ncbi:MAG: permease-like cell division protein FtsX [Eubacterium sp.]|nr:permease-like cell division protein FtsX [Eubacterium sp.]
MKRIFETTYSIKQGFTGLRRHRMFTLASIGTVSACLFLFGLFYFMLSNFEHIIQQTETSVGVTVFFNEGIGNETITTIGDAIKARPEVDHIEFVSAEQAWERFKRENFKDSPELIDSFGTDNPLKDSASYEIYLKNIAGQNSLVEYIETISGVRSVRRSDEIANNLTRINRLVSIVSITLISILILVSIFLIHSAIATGITVRKREIYIMRLMGASDSFVRTPFMVEGITIGILGAVIPLIILYFAYDAVVGYISRNFAFFADESWFLTRSKVFMILVPIAFGIGIGIGFLGSFLTVRKNLRVVAVALIASLLLGTAPTSYAKTKLDRDIADAREEQQIAKDRVDKVKEEIKALEKDKKDTLKYIKKIDKKMEKIAENIIEYELKINVSKIDYDNTQKELDDAQKVEDKQYDVMSRRIKYMYEHGTGSYLNMIFASQNISEFLGRAEYIEKISRYDKRIFNDFLTSRKKIESLKNEIASDITVLKGYRMELEAEQESMTALKKTKKYELKSYDKGLKQDSKSKAQYEKAAAKAQAQVEKLLAKKQSEVASSDDIGNTSGKLRWPLMIKGRISSYFGPRKAPTAGASIFHKGLDIAASQGTPIVAAASGKVITARYSATAGNFVMVAHSKKLSTAYMHCCKLNVHEGDKVKKGDVVGYVGSTGISTGAHLHFSVIKKGTYVNPLKYVKQPK